MAAPLATACQAQCPFNWMMEPGKCCRDQDPAVVALKLSDRGSTRPVPITGTPTIDPDFLRLARAM